MTKPTRERLLLEGWVECQKCGTISITREHECKEDLRKEPPVVKICWEDSYGVTPDWRETSELKPHSLIVTSIGFQLHSDRQNVVLAHSWSPDTDNTESQYCGAMTIPQRCIISQEVMTGADDE